MYTYSFHDIAARGPDSLYGKPNFECFDLSEQSLGRLEVRGEGSPPTVAVKNPSQSFSITACTNRADPVVTIIKSESYAGSHLNLIR